VDLLIPKTAGTDGYRLKGSTRFDDSSAFATLFTVGNNAGYLDPAVDRRVLSPMSGTNRVRAVFDPHTFSSSLSTDADLVDSEAFWLVLQPVVGGVAGVSSSPALILTARQRRGFDGVTIQGSAPLGADVAASLMLGLGHRMTDFTFTNQDGAHSLFLVLGATGTEFEIPPNSVRRFAEDSASTLLVRGAGAAVPFSLKFRALQLSPSPELWDPVVPIVHLSGANVALPRLQVSGQFFTLVVTLSGVISLPHLLISAQQILAVVTLSGDVSAPRLQLSGSFAPVVPLSGGIVLPSLHVSGTHSVAVILSGDVSLPSLQLLGAIDFVPTQVSALIAHWSANGSTGALLPNRISSGVGALANPVTGDQPSLMTVNGTTFLRFDGANSDLFTADVSALRSTGPRGYWAWHVRMPTTVAGARILYGQWGTTERFRVTSDLTTQINVQVALSAFAFAFSTFIVPLATQQAGMFLEILYDGSQATATARIKLFVDSTEIARAGGMGSIPATMLAGNAASAWLGSFEGASNKEIDVSHMYVGNDLPTAFERLNLRAFEAPVWGPA
jgi:hypothetical protein